MVRRCPKLAAGIHVILLDRDWQWIERGHGSPASERHPADGTHGRLHGRPPLSGKILVEKAKAFGRVRVASAPSPVRHRTGWMPSSRPYGCPWIGELCNNFVVSKKELVLAVSLTPSWQTGWGQSPVPRCPAGPTTRYNPDSGREWPPDALAPLINVRRGAERRGDKPTPKVTKFVARLGATLEMFADNKKARAPALAGPSPPPSSARGRLREPRDGPHIHTSTPWHPH